MKKNQKKWMGIIIIVLALAAFFIQGQLRRSKKNLTPAIKRGNIIEGVYGIGTVMANQSFDLKPGVNVIINDIFIKEGDEVPRGGKLVTMDGVLHKAPFKGIITYFPYKLGEIVFVQNKVLTLMDFTNRYLVVSLEQEGALRIKKGQKARLSFDSIRDETFEGIVESVYSQDQNFLARIGIAHLPPQILPGMTADVAIGIRMKEKALLIPIEALEAGYVYVLGKNVQRSKKVPVKVGVTDGQMAEILSGDLKEGDRLEIRQKLEE